MVTSAEAVTTSVWVSAPGPIPGSKVEAPARRNVGVVVVVGLSRRCDLRLQMASRSGS